MRELLITAIVCLVLGAVTTVFAFTATDHWVPVRDVYGTRVVKYQGDYYKLVHVKINGTVEIVE